MIFCTISHAPFHTKAVQYYFRRKIKQFMRLTRSEASNHTGLIVSADKTVCIGMPLVYYVIINISKRFTNSIEYR